MFESWRKTSPVEVDPLPDREPTPAERDICAKFIMYCGSSAGDLAEDSRLAARALDFYAHPNNDRILRTWVQELGVGVHSPADPKLLGRILQSLANRAPQKANELRIFGWDVPAPRNTFLKRGRLG